jgi:hypothetical protein
MRVSIYGHGMYRESADKVAKRFSAGPDGIFTVPTNVEILFHVDHGGMFDDTWEPILRSGQVPQEGNRGYTRVAAQGMLGRDYSRGDLCYNYRIGYGSNIQYGFNQSEGTPWPSINNLREDRNNFLYVDPKDLWVCLKDIILAIKRTQRGLLRIEWMACREVVNSGDARWQLTAEGRQSSGREEKLVHYFADRPK